MGKNLHFINSGKLQFQKWGHTNVYGWFFQRILLKNDHCIRTLVLSFSQFLIDMELSQILQSEKQYSDSFLANLPF